MAYGGGCGVYKEGYFLFRDILCNITQQLT